MNVRELALQTLDSIYKNKSFSNIELNKTIRENSTLSNLDKGLLTTLVYGTIKESKILDYEITKASENKQIKPSTRTLLKLSLYQIRFLDKVPDYAVINEAVEISKNQFGLMTSKFVNAVLRRLTREKFVPKMEDFKNDIEYYSTIYGIPSWVLGMVKKHYSEQVMKDYMESYKLSAPLTVRVNGLKTSKEKQLEKTYFEESKDSPVGLIYTGSKPINELEEFLNGEVAIQGESSQLVSLLLNPKENSEVVDMCAAPGGKTYHLADIMNNTGHIYSFDLHEHRVGLIANNLPRLGIKNVSIKSANSCDLSKYIKDESIDYVLLDAPCSGLGVIRRKPDILMNLKQDELDSLLNVQEKLLEEAHRILKVDGEMVYSTCTIDKKENDNQIETFLNKYSDMELVSKETIFPNKTTIDGFFMAKLIKRK